MADGTLTVEYANVIFVDYCCSIRQNLS